MTWTRLDYELRRAVKRILPARVTRVIQRWELARMVRSDERLPSDKERFDRVYRRQIWRSPVSGGSLSGAGSEGEWLERSVEFVLGKRLFDGRSVLDVGCGDLSFGVRVCGSAASYTGVDVSPMAIGLAQRAVQGRAKVRLLCLDAAEEPLPPAEIVVLRQVLQHQPNDRIRKILAAAARTGAKELLVFEDVPEGEFVANVDLPVSGQLTRLVYGSGVDLRMAPFGGPWELAARWARKDAAGCAPSCLVCYRLSV